MTHLVKAGMQLFAVESLVWYASQRQASWDHQLADRLLPALLFTGRRPSSIPRSLLSLRQSLWQDDSHVFRLAQDILAGKAEWMEEGILAWHPAAHGREDQLTSTVEEQSAACPLKH